MTDNEKNAKPPLFSTTSAQGVHRLKPPLPPRSKTALKPKQPVFPAETIPASVKPAPVGTNGAANGHAKTSAPETPVSPVTDAAGSKEAPPQAAVIDTPRANSDGDPQPATGRQATELGNDTAETDKAGTSGPAGSGIGIAAALGKTDWGTAGAAIRFLQGFDESGWHNLVAFDPVSGRPVDGRTFMPRTWRKMATWLNDKLARDFNVYFSVNEPKPNSLSKKLSKTDIGKIRALFGDVDPTGGAEELEAERARIRGTMAELMNEPMPPSFVIDSGGGCQAFWKIKPVDCNDANQQLAEDIGDNLSKLLGGDAVMNVDRIMRLPGTDNIPDAKKVRKGRVRRRATLLFDTRAVYTLEQLAEEFPAPPESERVARGGARRSRGESAREWTKYSDLIDMEAVRAANDYDELAEDLRMRFEAALARSPRLRALWEHGEKEGDRTGSGYVISLGFHLAHLGFSLMDFAHLAWVWQYTPGASGRAVNGGPRSLARVWARVEEGRARQPAEDGNPYAGLSFVELLAAAKAIDLRGDVAVADGSAEDQAKAAEAAAARMRVSRRQIIAAGVRARLQPDEIEELLQALKQSTGAGITILREIWAKAENAERRAERQRAAEASGDAAIGGDWMQALQRDQWGNIIANVHNAIVLLRSPSFAGMINYDELQAAAMLQRPVPEPGRSLPTDFRARMLDDIDLTTVQARLQRLWVPFISRNIVAEAIETVARDNSYHPIRDWLDGITWDQTPRLDTWLTDYLGAAANDVHSEDYLREIGPKFLISMVARVYRPGCKVDYMLVLEGGQGSIKSTACRALAGSEFFSDALRDITSKDASQHLRGLWLIEIAELEAMSKAESTAMKAFLTRNVERYRPPYGRKEVSEPRQCVFIGTTNENAYLKDATGNRRFWPVKVGRVELEVLKRDRNQLFAEAAQRFHAGEHWWPDADAEARTIQPVQASRFAQDLWYEPIHLWLDGLGDLNEFPHYLDGNHPIPKPKLANVRKEQATAYDINRCALGRRPADMQLRDRLRIVAILTELGWAPSHKSHGVMAYTRSTSGG